MNQCPFSTNGCTVIQIKGNNKVCLSITRAVDGSEVKLHAFLSLALGGREWLSSRFNSFLLGEGPSEIREETI
jgi:hypothetical protein